MLHNHRYHCIGKVVGDMAWGGLGTQHGSWRCAQVERPCSRSLLHLGFLLRKGMTTSSAQPTSVPTLRFAIPIHQVLGLQSDVTLVIGRLVFVQEVPYAVSQKT
jgi:hypothetical protein